MSRRDATAAWALLALVGALAFTFGFHRIDSSDIWIHLASGDYILDHRHVPDRDPFAAESPAPEWINTQWLCETLIAALHRAGGTPLLVCITGLAAAASIVLPFACMLRRAAPVGLAAAWPFAAAGLLASLIAYERFFVRPEAVSFLFTAIWICALLSADLSRRRTVVWIVALQIVWCNMHAAFGLGIAFATAAAIGNRLDRTPARPPAAWWLPLALLAVSCANPYGLRLPVHVGRSLLAIGQGPLQEGVVEWQPTFAGVDLPVIVGDITLVTFIVSLGFTAVAFVRARRNLRTADVLVVLGMTALAVLARRHLAMYAVSALPLAAAALSRANVPLRIARPVAIVTAALALWITAALARGDFYARLGPPRVTGWGISEMDHPIGATAVLRRLDVHSPVFTNLAAGSYLLWACRGDPAPFVDGRLLAPEKFARYRAALSSTRGFGALAQVQRFDAVLLSLTPHPPVVLFRHLVDLTAWQLVYMDAEGALFVHADVAARHPELSAIDPEQPLPLLVAAQVQVSIARAFVGQRKGLCAFSPTARRGEILLRLGYPAAAAADLSRALTHCPDPRLADLLRGIDSRRVAPGPTP